MREGVLLVEDDGALRRSIVRVLEAAKHDVTAVESAECAFRAMDERTFDVVVTDLGLPDASGFAVLDRVRCSSTGTGALVITGNPSADAVVEALRRGAHDYLRKPFSLSELQRKIRHVIDARHLRAATEHLRSVLHRENDPLAMLSDSGPSMIPICEIVRKVAISPSNVLVTGESGTGKDLVARAIHACSRRADGPYVALDAATIPDEDADAFFFGREADGVLIEEGVFQRASGGTLFLDEVSALRDSVQTKLLRAVETKEIRASGSSHCCVADVRIVAATEGGHRGSRLREDLRQRLESVRIDLPPLRDRAGAVPRLARQLLYRHALAHGREIHAFDAAATKLLGLHAWPGNVRELSHAVEFAVLVATGPLVHAHDLPESLRRATPDAGARDAEPLDAELDLGRALIAFQRRHVARVLDRVAGNREAAGRLLGLSPATLYRLLSRVGLKGYRGSEKEAVR